MIHQKHPQQLMVISIFFIFTGLACAIPGLNSNPSPSEQAGKPAVALSNPTKGQKLAVGVETKVQSVSVDAQGIARVELVINGEVIWVDANAKPEPDVPFIVAQPWFPDTPGTYIVRARAYNNANISGESEPVEVEVGDTVSESASNAPATATTEKDEIIVPNTATPLPSNIPSTTPVVEVVATPTATVEDPTPTPTSTLSPTPTPRPQKFTATGFEPDGRFKDIWFELGNGDSRLGYPTKPEIKDRDYAKQSFERGLMIWWDNPEGPNYIWVLDSPVPGFQSGGTSNRFNDTWEAGDDDYSCAEARNGGGPRRGFGKVWCDYPELQSRLGYPSEPEAGSGGAAPYALVQFFQGGLMFYNPGNDTVHVLFEQGDWQNFKY